MKKCNLFFASFLQKGVFCSLMVLAFGLFFNSCSNFPSDTEISPDFVEEKSQSNYGESSACISSIGDTLSLNNEYYKIGLYHNEILTELSELPILNSCSASSFEEMEDTIRSIVNQNADYTATFGHLDRSAYLGAVDYLVNDLDICGVDSLSQLADNLYATSSDYIKELETSDLFSQREIDLISDFMDSFFVNGDKRVDLTPFYNAVLSNPEGYFEDGKFILGLFIVYDYSFCFWSDYHEKNLAASRGIWSEIKKRVPLGVGGDLLGAFSSGMANVWRNRQHFNYGCGPCTDVDLLEDMGRGALTGSGGFVGNFINGII